MTESRGQASAEAPAMMLRGPPSRRQLSTAPNRQLPPQCRDGLWAWTSADPFRRWPATCGRLVTSLVIRPSVIGAKRIDLAIPLGVAPTIEPTPDDVHQS